MNKASFAIFFAVFSVLWANYAFAQAAKHKPDFKLTISTEDRTLVAQKDMEIPITVEEKNISNHPINTGKSDEVGDWYKMVVLLDGNPAPITERYRRILTPSKNAQRSLNDLSVPSSGSGSSWTIEPGETATFEVPLTAFFDLSTPGKYKITFSRATDRGQPDNVDVKSNTITVTVLPSDSAQPRGTRTVK
ncbi:MAG: hypothetical protein WBP85_17120 [Terracidiphilus sp.]